MPKAASTFATKQLGTKAHLANLFESGTLADITIKSDDKALKVHKLILTRSEVFAKMLTGETKEAQSAVIKIKDFSHEVIVEMCRFLYCDEVPKMESLALELMVAADKYIIEDLAAKCEKFLMKNITIENFHDVLVTANQLSKDKLREAAIDFIIA
jgi:speckle-type POZ protein